MKMLTPNVPKYQSIKAYERSHPRSNGQNAQDHGTKGTKAISTQAWNHESDPHVDGQHRRYQAAKADSLMHEGLRDYTENGLEGATSARLERAADRILHTADIDYPGFIDESFDDDYGIVEFEKESPSEYYSASGAPRSRGANLPWESSGIPSEHYLWDPSGDYSNNPETEIRLGIDRRRAAMMDVERAYQGQPNLDDDYGDWADLEGFHVTDRP